MKKATKITTIGRMHEIYQRGVLRKTTYFLRMSSTETAAAAAAGDHYCRLADLRSVADLGYAAAAAADLDRCQLALLLLPLACVQAY